MRSGGRVWGVRRRRGGRLGGEEVRCGVLCMNMFVCRWGRCQWRSCAPTLLLHSPPLQPLHPLLHREVPKHVQCVTPRSRAKMAQAGTKTQPPPFALLVLFFCLCCCVDYPAHPCGSFLACAHLPLLAVTSCSLCDPCSKHSYPSFYLFLFLVPFVTPRPPNTSFCVLATPRCLIG